MKFFFISLIAISIILFLVPHIVYAATKLLSMVFNFRVNYKPFGITALALIILWIGIAVYGNLWGRFKLERKELTLSFSNLPASFDGYRIVHISDLHLDGFNGHEKEFQTVVDSINNINADAIFFTGDIVSLEEKELTPFIPILKELRAKDGVYSILGNHDYLPYNRTWSDKERNRHIAKLISMQKNELNWHLLMNENHIISNGTDSIAVLGSENQSMGIHAVIKRGDLKKTMLHTDGMFRILLTHDPTHWRGEVLSQTDIPLTLSGHTHGGQMKVFGLFYASTFLYKEHAGLYSENGHYLYVNTGIGGTMPMRLGIPAEITVITLKRKIDKT